jgi:hypothetical protein
VNDMCIHLWQQQLRTMQHVCAVCVYTARCVCLAVCSRSDSVGIEFLFASMLACSCVVMQALGFAGGVLAVCGRASKQLDSKACTRSVLGGQGPCVVSAAAMVSFCLQQPRQCNWELLALAAVSCVAAYCMESVSVARAVGGFRCTTGFSQ